MIHIQASCASEKETSLKTDRFSSRDAAHSSLQVGLIGCGGFVRGNHLPNLAKEPGFVIRAICDLNAAVLAPLQSKYDPNYVTQDAEKLIRDPSIDLILIGTKPDARLPLIRAAVNAGKAVFVEKPLGTDWEETREILRIFRARPTPCMVGLNRPYSRIMQEVKRIFSRHRRGPTLISYRIVCEDILWPEHHRQTLRSGQSTILHEICHIFDLLNWLTDSLPETIYAVGGRSDNNLMTLTYPNETQATIISGGCGTEGFPKEQMEIFTNHGVIRMNEFVELNVAQIPGEEDQFFPVKFNPRGPLDGFTEASLRKALKAARQGLTPEQIAVGYYYDVRVWVDKGHREEIRWLRDCLLEKKPIPTNEVRGAQSVFLALKALESLKSGQVVPLDWTALMKL
ncbi:MAG: Gfo/Idh/MocA family oxidoreductase [Verrucomicrobiae bacterium]|nr:Gfo/Idh/MocA family oxidoreductase [Verrucomicrobiae bacterium]